MWFNEYNKHYNVKGVKINSKSSHLNPSSFKFATLNHNQNVTARRFEPHLYVDVVITVDAYKLSHLSK
jgi:hypothetical protein